jgi:hypothetical protein
VKKHDNVYLRGRACIESVRGNFMILSFSLLFSLVLPLFVPFIYLAVFPSST